MSQSDALNASFFYTSLNPAFAASPLDFNRLAAYAQPQAWGAQVNYNLNSIYSAIGFSTLKTNHVQQLSLNYAYHTYVSSSEHHLLCGASLNTVERSTGLMALPSFGVALCSNPPSRFFAGLNWQRSIHFQQSESSEFVILSQWRLQAGILLFRISRQAHISGVALAQMHPGRFGSKMYNRYTALLTCWWPGCYAGIGWLLSDSNRHNALLRLGLRRKVSFGTATLLSFTTGKLQFIRPELSVQYPF